MQDYHHVPDCSLRAAVNSAALLCHSSAADRPRRSDNVGLLRAVARRSPIAVLFALGLGLLEPAAVGALADEHMPPNLSAEFLRETAEEFLEEPAVAADDSDFGVMSDRVGPDEQEAGQAPRPPVGASSHQNAHEAISVEAGSVLLERGTPKSAPGEFEEGASESRSGDETFQLSFSSGSFSPAPGIDQRLQRAVDAASAADATPGVTYAFVLTNEYPSPEMERDFEALGVEVLGPHDEALKIKLPLDNDVLRALVDLPYVEWIGYSQPTQKLESALRSAMTAFAGEVEEFPIIISLFEDDSDGRFAARLREAGVALGRYDPELASYQAVASAAEIEALAELDFVLFVEVERPSRAGHDQSMATMGADYIRSGGGGTRFSGASTILGILDTGFMVGDAAAVPHDDLNRFGCGRNFTPDAADVWNDENGHGTHVLGTIMGTGTANARYRGVATGVAGSGSTRVRAAKVWRRNGRGAMSWMRSAMDYMDDVSDCGSPGPEVINISGGASGTGQTGTDSTSRKLDNEVWTHRQAYVVCGGNSGSGPRTIWSPGVAKNAFTVGNARDSGFLTVGDASNSSSRGPTGDGRMKPNVVGAGTVVTSARAGTTNGYSNKSGCSMATPHVSGIAATLMQHYPAFRSRPDLLRAHLMAASLLHDDDTLPRNNSSGGRNTYGLGRVSSYVAHWVRNNTNGWTTHWSWRTITNTNWAFRDITVPSGTDRLVIVMTWDEPAASAGASRAVSYDLDLWADHQADCVPDAKGQCGEWASQSFIDNTEYLIINNPPSGTYRLKIVNWNAPSFGLPASIAAIIVRGDPTPNMILQARASRSNPPVGSTFTVSTRVFSPSYVTSGVHLQLTGLSSGVRLLSVRTIREDRVRMDFGTTFGVTLGNTRERDSRTAIWTFRVGTGGRKLARFRAWSENGGTKTATVAVNP